MKAENVRINEMAARENFSSRKGIRPETAPSKPAVLEDRVTLSQEALLKAKSDAVRRAEEIAPSPGIKKTIPDPRYTAQAILDRELLALKKFYS